MSAWTWLPAGPCTVPACVTPPSRTAGPLRRVVRVAGVLAVVLVALPWMAVARRLGGESLAAATMAQARLLLRVLGITVRVRDGFTVFGGARSPRAAAVAEDGPALIVANHVSWLDPLVVAAVTPCKALAKSEIARWPVLRTLVAGSGAVFIDRERLSLLPATVRRVADLLRSGESVVAFPEGTTWCGRGTGVFRPAFFQAAVDAGVPVRPVALRYGEAGGALATAPAFVGEDTLLASLGRVLASRELEVEVTLFPLLAYEAGVSRRELAGIARATVSGDLPRVHEVPVAA
ncbi:lysophospholipid acyltransferase family protein [Sphaerisporangium rubeum]|uniref:1-acyl-sn-glycerol-3-phosphate acyltransferase n=1 Tax=Sphaerisporangium rubeum TaxID=321317 RepID=A0A7X0IA67_9ACTN|nr:lysophospholipid acyltransferase family protein [Sphaerisporangium rubeum]MBB6471308.1 1-acyl-sn-glycerol-3-phosphate acyltransferase [Sphaerisporangium rubeum]